MSAQALLRNFAAGEARLDVADAALQIGAEDDALVSHSPVALPVPYSALQSGSGLDCSVHWLRREKHKQACIWACGCSCV